MSNRTIVEFNHDFSGSIDKDPEGFLLALKEMLRSGVNCCPENKNGREIEIELSRFGVTTIPTAHHSEDRRVIIGSHTYRVL